MSGLFLRELFSKLNEANLRYCVLRGYEGLPVTIKNDVDFGVAPSDKIEFFNILKNLTNSLGYKINIDLIRFSIIKMQLINENYEIIKIDIWWDFNFVGFKYIEIEKLLDTRQLYNNIIFIPSNEYEFALSFLKELLHNNWIRSDKIATLKSKISNQYYLPFQYTFSDKLVNEFISAINDNRSVIKKISLKAKFNLVVSNFKNQGCYRMTKNIYLFFKIKYFYKNEYDYLIK